MAHFVTEVGPCNKPVPLQSSQMLCEHLLGNGILSDQIPVLRIREFNLQIDDQHSMIINETMAGNLFPGQHPIGRQIRQDKDSYTVIGVARNSKSRTIGESRIHVSQCGSGKSEHRRDLDSCAAGGTR